MKISSFFAMLLLATSFSHRVSAEGVASYQPTELLYGVAYYDEYMPEERIETDFKMMREAGINVIRIAESTWATMEPEPGKFNFTHIDRTLEAAERHKLKVIVGTPTYAIPPWMAKRHPEIMVTRRNGQALYGARQSMDITNTHYRDYAQRAITTLIKHVAQHPTVIGYQVDNETKHYGTAGENVQQRFVAWMKPRYRSLDDLNHQLGLNYWSNRINSWEEFPSVNGTINASLAAEFAEFQREIVTEFLSWQVDLVNQHKVEGQFVTQNFDFEWRGYSYGIQPDVDHFTAAEAMDIASVDIYHPSQDQLTGTEISFAGDMARAMKHGSNYFVMETEAQGFANWTPYPGQLRLQAFSHIASGAAMVAYWPWHSIHNAAETYWKGLLSHDFLPNPTYNEAITIGRDFAKLSPVLARTHRKNDVAILFSNQALTGFNAFSYGWGETKNYNDVLRPFYDALYRQNIGVDFIDTTRLDELNNYKLVVVPALYAASDAVLEQLNRYAKDGGHLIYSFKSGFANEKVAVRTTPQPGVINEAAGVYYSQFVRPTGYGLAGDPFNTGANNTVTDWAELLEPRGAEVLAKYDHSVWGKYAAVTRNQYGKGVVTYVGTLPSDQNLEAIVRSAALGARVIEDNDNIRFPVILKTLKDANKKTTRFFFNYSSQSQKITYPFSHGKDLLSGLDIAPNEVVELAPWDFFIVQSVN